MYFYFGEIRSAMGLALLIATFVKFVVIVLKFNVNIVDLIKNMI